MNQSTDNFNSVLFSLLVSLQCVMPSLSMSGDYAQVLADSIVTGDTQQVVIAKLGRSPKWTESSRFVGVETQTMAFSVDGSEMIIIRFVFGRVASVSRMPRASWENR